MIDNSHNGNVENQNIEIHRSIIENITDPVFITDDQGQFTYISPTIAHALGFSIKEIEEIPTVTRFMGSGQPLFDSDELKQLGRIDNIKTVIVDKKGRERDYLVTVKKVAIQNGTVLYICRDITDLRQAEFEHRDHIYFLESLEQIDKAIRLETDIEKMLWKIVEKMLEIFNCDRVWLLYPCDPDASTWQVPVEITRPEWPGAYESDEKVAMTPDVADTFRELLETDEPIFGVVDQGEAEWDQEDRYSIRSFLSMAVKPRIGKAWDLGMHQCSYSREWTSNEVKLFKEIGRRIGDALTSILSLRNLKESEALLNETQELAKIGGWVWFADTEKVLWTNQVYQIFELPQDSDIDHFRESMSCVDQQYKKPLAEAFEKAREEGIPYDLELEITTKKGNRRWVRTMANPVIKKDRVVKITGDLIDITETKKAQEEQAEYIGFLENMELIDRAIKEETDVERMLENVLQTVFDIFGCDRAWLLYPCDPNEPSFRIPVEIARPEYPGGKALNLEIPMSGDQAQDLLDALSSKDPVTFTTETMRGVSKETAEDFDVKTQMFIAIYPKLGKPWMLGMHQCSSPRVWTSGEQKLFKEISRRMEDGLSSLLFLRDLRESEERFRATFEQAAVGVAHVSPEGRWLKVNKKLCDIVGYSRDELLEKTFQEITHPDDLASDLEAVQCLLEKKINSYRSEKRYIRKDGTSVWIDLTVSVVWQPSGEADYFIGVIEDVTRRKTTEEALQKSRVKYKDIFENILDVYVESDMEGNIAEISPSIEKNMGYKREDLIGTTASQYYADPEKRDEMIRSLQSHEGTSCFALDAIHKDGRRVPVSVTSTLVRDDNGNPVKLIGMIRDVTEQKKAEQEKEKLQKQLVQAQKMESVGRLAGGVAHDFNNILNIVLGYTDLILENVREGDPFHADLQEIHKAGLKAVDLTRQLLAFARKQTVTPKVLDLNKVVENMLNMVERLIGENVELIWQPGEKLWPVRIDPGQIDQILANLCINARDAIEEVGTITIETSNAILDDVYCIGHPHITPGEYICLKVADDGCGMTDEVRQNLFEPFFTTKRLGEGTGLGLATVYGIIKQNNGVVDVDSSPGQGSIFRIYLPCHIGKTEDDKVVLEDRPTINEKGSETILLVEDEPSLLKLCSAMLERLGYHVLEAGTPGQAIATAREYPGMIDLLITDVVMPEMNGRELCKHIQPLYPSIKRLFMSGYTSDIIAHHGIIEEGVQFIHKPFSMDDLKKKLREILEE